jgi:hypothetical protein
MRRCQCRQVTIPGDVVEHFVIDRILNSPELYDGPKDSSNVELSRLAIKVMGKSISGGKLLLGMKPLATSEHAMESTASAVSTSTEEEPTTTPTEPHDNPHVNVSGCDSGVAEAESESVASDNKERASEVHTGTCVDTGTIEPCTAGSERTDKEDKVKSSLAAYRQHYYHHWETDGASVTPQTTRGYHLLNTFEMSILAFALNPHYYYASSELDKANDAAAAAADLGTVPLENEPAVEACSEGGRMLYASFSTVERAAYYFQLDESIIRDMCYGLIKQRGGKKTVN